MNTRILRLVSLSLIILSLSLFWADHIASADSPVLNISMSVSDEPLLGGQVGYKITVKNTGSVPVEDKGYNLTLTNTLPISINFVSANPAPTFISRQANGETLVIWNNIADLEVNETLDLDLVASLDSGLSAANTFINNIQAIANKVPDNSGNWVSANAQIIAKPQAIDIEMVAHQSTGDEQATGAGEYDASAPGRGSGPDWLYQYKLTVKNNNRGNSAGVVAKAILPPGVAYLGQPTIFPNPNNSPVTPTLSLQSDGSLELGWSLGTLSTGQHNAPITIQFNAAIPYKYRTVSNNLADDGPFAGPMKGAIIPEDTVMLVGYEATATYQNVPTADGSQSTPDDDAPIKVTAEYATVSKSASPKIVGIGSTVTFNLNYYISEYYTATNVILTDVLPDGMTYQEDSASLEPTQINANTPGPGQTTLVWNIPAGNTTPGKSGTVIFRATVDPTYEASPYTGQPVVSGDSLTNHVTLNSDWQDAVSVGRSGNGIPDDSKATVTTRMPLFLKQVWNEVSQSWVQFATGFTGDTMRFRLVFDAAADVDAKGIIIRDFLPRGMTYVSGSAVHTQSGSFSNGLDCNTAPTSPIVDALNGLQFVEWRLCNVSQGSHWEVTIDAIVSDIPQVQPGWLVANFGKLSGHNTPGVAYSLRDTANVDYIAPELLLTKTATPGSNLVAGDGVVYTISVTNQGEAPAYNLTLADTVPPSLLVPASGGSGGPTASSYTVTSGNPAGGAGGTLQWTLISQLDPGATQTFTYSATIPNGLPAGTPLTNRASVSYNSRSDNQGHQTPATSNLNDLNTDDETIYVRGVTLSKTANVSYATIGDTVRWTLTGTVPSGFIAYWPVIEEDTLPNGFDYIPGSAVIAGANLDTTNHPGQPDDNGHNKLNWFLQTLDNSAGAQPLVFTINFNTLVTGVNGNNVSQTYYNSYCCLEDARNQAYARWYETAAGAGNGYGAANTGGWRSGAATFTVKIRQPKPTLLKSSTPANVEAGDLVTHTLTIFGAGNDIAYEALVEDELPDGTTFVETVNQTVTYPFSPPPTPVFTHTDEPGATHLSYQLDRLFVGSTWSIVYTTRIDEAISAGRALTNTATAVSYSSQPGSAPDSNGDGLPDERVYIGPSSSAAQYTPPITLLKEQSNPGELTFGSTLVYTLTVPTTPINATVYDMVLTDVVDSRLQVTNVGNAIHNGNTVSASFASIPPNTQQTINIEVIVPQSSAGLDGDLVTNTAELSHRHGKVTSNSVQQQLVAPALTLDKHINQNFIAEDDVVTYTLLIANVGQGLARNLVVTDPLPANMSYVGGSSQLNGQPIADPVESAWALPDDLLGGSTHTLSFQVHIDSVEQGQSYLNTATVTGQDSLGQPIPADNSSRVPADTDPNDQDSVGVYSQLLWQQETTFVAYEDLKNTGWSDWDYNDLVVRIEANKGLTVDGDLAVLIINYEALARGAAYDHNFIHNLPLEGGGQAELIVHNADREIVTQTSNPFGDNAEFSIFNHTAQALPSAPGFFNTNTSTSQPETIYGYTATLTIQLNDPAANPAAALPPLPWDPYIVVYNTGQAVHLVIPGHLDNTQIVNGVHDPGNPMLGYDLPLAQTFYPGWKWPLEFAGIWRGYPQYVNFLGSGGVSPQNWYAAEHTDNQWLWTVGVGQAPSMARLSAATVTPRYFASPTIADLNNDGLSEIIISTLLTNQVEVYNAAGQMQPGWPQSVGKDVKAAAAVADLDKDGDLEIVVGAGNSKLYAWHHTGQAVAGWPVTLADNFRILATPAVVDLDGDSGLDIIVPQANGKLYAFNTNGTAKSGWPVSLGNVEDLYESQVINSSPRIANLDGNGNLEIIVGSTDKKLYVLNSNGSLRWSYTTGDMVFSTPAVADFDAARPGLEIAFGSGDSYAYLLDKDGSLLWKKRTGWTIRSSATAADLDGDGDLEILIGGDDDKLWAWHHTGTSVSGWPQTTGADLFSSPAVGDIDGDGTPEVLIGSDDAHVYAWHANGTPAAGWPHATSLSVKGTPALANLDNDPALEVVAGDFGGVLYIWNFSGTFPDNTADLSVTMSGPKNPVELGSVITYTVTISNNGPSIASGVVLTDVLPSGLAFLGAAASQGSCSAPAGTVLCNLAVLTSSAQANVTLTLRAELPKTFVHRVKVAGTGLDPNPNNNEAEVTTTSSFSTVVNPNLDSTLTYTDSVSGHHFQVWLPVGAVTDTIALRYSVATTPVVISGLHFVGHAFRLDAYRGNTGLENFTFQRTVTVTLTYLDADVSGLNENELQLYYWNVAASTWAPAACGDYIRHPAENWLSVPICHLTEFGLFSPEEQSSGNNKLFLPLIFR